MKLQIGGKERVDGWINLDIERRDEVDIVSPADSIPLEPATVDEIYASHVLEHFSYFQSVAVLREWRRVLINGGRLSVAVPDMDVLCKLYLATADDYPVQFHIQRIIYGGQSNEYDFHAAGFNFVCLKASLEAAGFEQIERVEVLSDWADCSLVQVYGHPISLNVRAVAKKLSELS